MTKEHCHICGYYGEINGTVDYPTVRICLMCYLRTTGGNKMSWNDAIGGGKSDRDATHLKIKPDQTIKVHVLLKDGEEPVSYWTHFVGGRGFICPGRDICPACATDVKSKRQHAINIWDYASQKVMILEQGNSIMQQLKLILDQYGSFEKIDVSIKRVGEKLNTQYMVMPMPRTEPFDWSGKELHDLDSLKVPSNVADVNRILNGKENDSSATTGPVVPPTEQGPPNVPSQPAGNTDPTQYVLPFGKYQGKTMENVAQTDLNYVKWIAENITDIRVKSAAKLILKKQDTDAPNTAPPPSTPTTLSRINTLLSSDKYKSDIPLVMTKMKEATATPTNPTGKSLLFDYTEQELEKLESILNG